MFPKQLYNLTFQKQVFSGGSNPNEGNQQPPNENNEDRLIPPVNPNMPNSIQAAQLLQRRRQVGLSPAMSNEDKKRCCVLWTMSYTLGSKKHYLDGNTYSM